MDTVGELLLRHWGWREAQISPLGGGMNSETWLVEHLGSTYVAKQVAPAALAELTAGCEAAALLAEAGFVTGRPVPTGAGELVVAEAALTVLEHVPGRELAGGSVLEQQRIGRTLAGVHAAVDRRRGPGTSGFFDWLGPQSPGVAEHAWLAPAIDAVREETDALEVTWSLLHTDPLPGAFLHDEATGVIGLIDWTGAQRGPVLYDVASAVMYLGGPDGAAAFLDTYRAHGPLDAHELRHLDAFRRFRWVVQAAYFAGRLAACDLTGVASQADNDKGLSDARRGLAELGVETA